MDWLTFWLVVFAFAQYLITRQAETSRARARAADDARVAQQVDKAMDAAFQMAYAEHFRFWALSQRMLEADLVELSAFRALHPESVTPKDATRFVESLTHLSLEAGYLAATAYAMAHDVAREITMLNSHVDDCRALRHSSARELSENARRDRPVVVTLEANIKRWSRQLSLLTLDAARHSPRLDMQRRVHFRPDCESDIGRGIYTELSGASVEELLGKEQPPQPIASSG